MGTSPALITSWMWESLQAVRLESVQAASFWMWGFGWHSSSGNIARAPAFRTHWACLSVPAMMLPTALSDGALEVKDSQFFLVNCIKNAQNRLGWCDILFWFQFKWNVNAPLLQTLEKDWRQHCFVPTLADCKCHQANTRQNPQRRLSPQTHVYPTRRSCY